MSGIRVEGLNWMGVRPQIAALLEKALGGEALNQQEGLALFECLPREEEVLSRVADQVRQQRVGDQGSFVITRNINFTNVCNMGCSFCGFAKRKHEAGAELLSLEEVARRAREAWDRGATEVCIQGGLHPDIEGNHYRRILQAVKAEVPDIHIHAFSPFEIFYGARKSRLSYADFIQDLIEHGLGSMPGTAAEILDVEIRQQLTKDKLSTAAWVEIIGTAHRLGLPTTSTIMYGHVDQPRHWAAHIQLLADMQSRLKQEQPEARGFTEFVPLGFVHYESPLYTGRSEVRPGPTASENLRMHAVSRLMLQGKIDNIQASWVKLGPEYAERMLRSGANDLGGTLMNESISRAAGGKHGQEIVPADMVAMIRRAGLQPVRRNTLYQSLQHYRDEAALQGLHQRIPLLQVALGGAA